MNQDDIRKLYGPFWKANSQFVSDEAVALIAKLSVESISGLEGADFIALTPILSDALTAAREAQREALAGIQFAKVIPVDQGWTVSIDSLGIKLYGTESAAQQVCSAINVNVAAAIRQGVKNQSP